MIRIKSLLLVVLAFSLVMGWFTTDSMAQQKVFKFGVLGPYTGPGANVGAEMKNGAIMAFEKIGYKIGDYKIELVFIDDQSDAAKSTNAYAEAVERLGVQASMSNWNTAVTVACMDLWTKYKIPHFFSMGAGKAVNDKWAGLPPDKRYLIMKGWPIPQKMTQGYADLLGYAVEKGIWKPQQKLMALWEEDTDWGRGIAAGIRDRMVQKGWKVFTEEYFSLTQTDFYPFLSKCKQAGVTALLGGGSVPAPVTACVKQASEIGLKAMIVADGLAYIGDWYKLTGATSDGVLDMQPQYVTPAQKAWAKEFEAKYNITPGPTSAGHNYDYANYFIKIAKRALEKYKNLDSESIYKVGVEEVATGKLTYTMAEGAIIHKRYGCTAESAPDPAISPDDFYFPVVQFKGGEGKVVWPEYMKEMNLMVK
jgi:branched-chain amino acid transport system substrate-binding protein